MVHVRNPKYDSKYPSLVSTVFYGYIGGHQMTCVVLSISRVCLTRDCSCGIRLIVAETYKVINFTWIKCFTWIDAVYDFAMNRSIFDSVLESSCRLKYFRLARSLIEATEKLLKYKIWNHTLCISWRQGQRNLKSFLFEHFSAYECMCS